MNTYLFVKQQISLEINLISPCTLKNVIMYLVIGT